MGVKLGVKSDRLHKQKKTKGPQSPIFPMVPEVGLEPTRLAAHDFESTKYVFCVILNALKYNARAEYIYILSIT